MDPATTVNRSTVTHILNRNWVDRTRPLWRLGNRLHRLHVAPEVWGSGIGGALHDACLRGWGDDGLGSAALWVLERKVKARAWYERRGWANTGVRRTVSPPQVDALDYKRKLSRHDLAAT